MEEKLLKELYEKYKNEILDRSFELDGMETGYLYSIRTLLEHFLESMFNSGYNKSFVNPILDSLTELKKEVTYKEDGLFYYPPYGDSGIRLVYRVSEDFSNLEYNYFLKDGSCPFPDTYFTNASKFKDGYSKAFKDGKFVFIDEHGKIVFNELNIISGDDFSCGLARVLIKKEQGKVLEYISSNGILPHPTDNNIPIEYEKISNFKDNLGLVQRKSDHKVNYINNSGNVISSIWYDEIYDFCDGFARVKQNNRYNFIDTNGDLLFTDSWLSEAYDFSEGFARVLINNKWNFIDVTKQFISQSPFEYAEDFKDGVAYVVTKNKQANYIDYQNNLLISTDEGKKLFELKNENNVELITINGERYLVVINISERTKLVYNTDCELIFDFSDVFENAKGFNQAFDIETTDARKTFKMSILEKASGSFIRKMHESNIPEKGIKKRPFSYFITSRNIDVKYKPIYEYEYHIICENKDGYYLYDIKKKSYLFLGAKEDVFFHSGIIVNTKDDTAIFIDSIRDNFIDIKELYDKKLKLSKSIKYNRIDFLNYFDFKEEMLKDPDFSRFLKSEVARVNKEIEDKEIKRKAKILEQEAIEKFKKDEKKRKEIADLIAAELKIISEHFEKISTITGQNNLDLPTRNNTFIQRDVLLIPVGDHFEIRPTLVNYLKYLNLAAISFDNVLVAGIDWRNTNADFNPQTVYGQNMSNSDFRGVYFKAGTSFVNVDVSNSLFDNNKLNFTNFEGAITNSSNTR